MKSTYVLANGQPDDRAIYYTGEEAFHGGELWGNINDAKRFESKEEILRLVMSEDWTASPIIVEIMELWEKHHLNDRHAGTPEQEKAVKKLRERNNGRYLNYDEICLHLKWMNLYEVELDGESYRYGSARLYREITEKDLRRIKEIIETGR